MKIFIIENVCTVYKLLIHKMQIAFFSAGHKIVEDIKDADLVIAGLCAAFEADEKKSLNIIDKILASKKDYILYGCMIAVNPGVLPESKKYYTWEYNKLIKYVSGARIALEFMPTEFRHKTDYRVYNTRKKFIPICFGCSFSCSFCPHKKGAGELESIPEKSILKSIEEIKNDCDTIVLTGIDTACYGKDIFSSFGTLLKKILKIIPESVNIHIAQFNPEGLFFYDGLIRTLGDERIKDLQLPIQTASQRLLKIMNRNYDIEKLRNKLLFLKKINTDIKIRTDILVGFPNELYRDCETTVNFVKDFFSEVALYIYEPKVGTGVYDIKPTNKNEIDRRFNFIYNSLSRAGILVHRGGQNTETLIINDQKKEKLWNQGK